MPELPEVESLKRQIEKVVKPGTRLVRTKFLRADIRDTIPKSKIKSLEGQALRGLERRSKYLLFRFSQGYLISHLGMTGSWRVLGEKEKIDKTLHDHAVLEFESGLSLVYRDARRFGIIDYTTIDGLACHKRFKDLGPEPLSREFEFETFYRKIKSSKANIKTLLMNPKLVVGVGNIYASELLYLARLKPQRLGLRVTRKEAELIHQHIPVLLEKAINAGGSSIRDYQSLSGDAGGFQLLHAVYGREGQECRICHTSIKMLFQGGRSTFWCPQCQK